MITKVRCAAQALLGQGLCLLAVPVKTPQRMLGVTSLLDRDTPRPDAEHGMELLSLFADQAALALASIDRFSAPDAAIWSVRVLGKRLRGQR